MGRRTVTQDSCDPLNPLKIVSCFVLREIKNTQVNSMSYHRIRAIFKGIYGIKPPKMHGDLFFAQIQHVSTLNISF